MPTSGESEAAPPAAHEPVDERGGRRRLAWSAAVFSIATGASRVLGLFREVLVRRYFGVEGPINAFTVAFQIPNLIRALAADVALSAALVPVFSELLEKRESERAWRVAATLLSLMLVGLGAATGLLMLIAPSLMRLFGLGGELEELAVGLSRVLVPIVVLFGISGVVVAILNSYEQFSVPAIMPVFWNLVIIGALVVGVPRVETASGQLYLYAAAVLAATVIQVVTPAWWLRGHGWTRRPLIDLRDPALKRVFAMMLPVTLGIGLINFNLVINTFFAARYIDPELAPSAIDAAFRVYMLPQGMFAIAVATVLFPRLSRLAARGDTVGFRDTVSLGIRQIGFLLIPASAVAAVLAVPIVRLLYERGAFDSNETTVVAQALAAFALGLTFNGAMVMLNRTFFSLQSPWVPTTIALANLTLNVVLNAALYRVGVWGIPLATSLVNIAGTAALLVVLRRRLGPVSGRAIMSAYLRIALASALAAGLAFGVWYGLDELVGRSLLAQLASVGAAIAGATVVFLALARLLRLRELDAIVSLVRRRREHAA